MRGRSLAEYPSGLRGRIANPLFVGSNPTSAFPKPCLIHDLRDLDPPAHPARWVFLLNLTAKYGSPRRSLIQVRRASLPATVSEFQNDQSRPPLPPDRPGRDHHCGRPRTRLSPETPFQGLSGPECARTCRFMAHFSFQFALERREWPRASSSSERRQAVCTCSTVESRVRCSHWH